MREKAWKHYYDRLSKGIDKGFSPDLDQYDPELAHALKYDIARFSAFKETSFKKQLEAAMTKNGRLLPWSEFRPIAAKLSGDYNKRWLKTEYDHTVAQAKMAAKWKDWEQNTDLYPNLRYETVGDDRVRSKHREWDGLVLPLNHSFWKNNLPPRDWGCRCDAVPTDEEPSIKIPKGNTKAAFKGNPALDGKVFNDSAYEKGLTKTEKRESQRRAVGAMYKNELAAYKSYDFDFHFEGKKGGYLDKFTTGSQTKNERVDNMITAKILADLGGQYRLLPWLKDKLSPDAFNYRTGNLSDFKKYGGNNVMSGVQSAMSGAQAQGAAEVVIRFTIDDVDMAEVWKAINRQYGNKRSKDLRDVILIFGDGSSKMIEVDKVWQRYEDKYKRGA